MPGYAYNASAIGLGGVIKRGTLTTVVPTVASVCLSPSGGDASVSYDNYYRDDISFARAESRVSGSQVPMPPLSTVRRYVTYSEVYLRDLRIFDRIRIAVMQATMTSTREVQDRGPVRELDPDQTQFDIFVMYRGVEIDGGEVAPDVDASFCCRLNYGGFAGEVAASPRQGEILESSDAGIAVADFNSIASNHKPFVGSVVKGLASRHFPSNNHKVNVGRFGDVRFGQILVKPDRQRFNLLRLELVSDWTGTRQDLPTVGGDADAADVNLLMSGGAGDGGSLSGGGGGSNGIPIWP